MVQGAVVAVHCSLTRAGCCSWGRLMDAGAGMGLHSRWCRGRRHCSFGRVDTGAGIGVAVIDGAGLPSSQFTPWQGCSWGRAYGSMVQAPV